MSRVYDILAEWKSRADEVGSEKALHELATALSNAESRYDELARKVCDLVVINDRRGIFLPPFQGR